MNSVLEWDDVQSHAPGIESESPPTDCDPTAGLPELPASKPLINVQQRLLAVNARITTEPPDRSDILHSVMCQAGMSRRATEARTFERNSGPFIILLEAGQLWAGKNWKPQPLPYVTTLRLVMVHLSSEAIRSQSRSVEVGYSIRQFQQLLGIGDGGGPLVGYTLFRKQMEALAACKLTIGMQSEGRVSRSMPSPSNASKLGCNRMGHSERCGQESSNSRQTFTKLWPITRFHRALSTLKHSALPLDV